jgi:hypothetical protein
MSAYTQPIEHLSAYGKCTRIASIDHGASDHGRPRPQIREPVEINIVKNSRTIRCQRLVVECPEFFVAPMLRAQARGNRPATALCSLGRDRRNHRRATPFFERLCPAMTEEQRHY